MSCDRAMDLLMEETGGASIPLIDYVRVRFHLLHCRSCGREAHRYEQAIDLMRSDFLPVSPDFRDAIMAAIRRELDSSAAKAMEEGIEEIMSFRNWMVGGLLIFASLALSPFGVTWGWLVKILGPDLLLPISLTLGVVLTAYCALFIGSHLKELAERFGLPREG